MKIPHDIFSLFSLTCTRRISSSKYHSHSFPHNAGQGGNGGRKLHLSTSVPPLNWQSSFLECSCNVSRHHSTCPGQLQCERSFISEVWVGHSCGLYLSPCSQQYEVMWHRLGNVYSSDSYMKYRSGFCTDERKPTNFTSLQVAIQALILLPLTLVIELTLAVKVKGRIAVKYSSVEYLGKSFNLCCSLPSSAYTWLI